MRAGRTWLIASGYCRGALCYKDRVLFSEAVSLFEQSKLAPKTCDLGKHLLLGHLCHNCTPIGEKQPG